MFEVDEETLGSFTVSIDTNAQPLWFGDFDTSKLAVHNGQFSAKPLQDCYALVYIVIDDKLDNFNLSGYGMYLSAVPKVLAVEHLIGIMRKHYLDSIVELKTENGYTIH